MEIQTVQTIKCRAPFDFKIQDGRMERKKSGAWLSKAEGPNSRFSVTRDARAKVPVTVPGHLDYQIIASLAALSHRANQPAAQANSLSILPVIDCIDC
jgi:hypothetical protein